MEIKLKRVGVKYLLPIISFSALLAAVVIAGLSFSFPAKQQKVLVASVDIAAGEMISERFIEETVLPLGSLVKSYLSSFQSGYIANTSIKAGELIPKSAISNQVDLRVPVRINGLPQISKAIDVGDRVDVWSTALNNMQPSAPEPVVFGAIVVAIESNTALAQATTSVELRIAPDYLEPLLMATDSNHKISLILQETLSDAD